MLGDVASLGREWTSVRKERGSDSVPATIQDLESKQGAVHSGRCPSRSRPPLPGAPLPDGGFDLSRGSCVLASSGSIVTAPRCLGARGEVNNMRVSFSSSCAIGLALAFLVGAAPTARGQQRTTSTRRIPVTKDRPTRPMPPAPPRVNQDSIDAVARERARQDSIAAAAERNRQDLAARQEQMRRDSIEIAERQRQDSIAAAEQARQDSIARAHDRAQSRDALRSARRYNSGFYMAIAGGSTMPMGDLKTADIFDMGWNVTVPFGWDFSRIPLGIRFDLAMDNLMAKSTIVDPFGNPMRNVVVYSGSGGLKLNVPLFRTASRFYLIGGAGAHRNTGYATAVDSVQTIMKAKTNIGWYGGAGLNFRFGRTALFVESRYINIDSKQAAGFGFQKANYLPIILGLEF